jgi:tetratricopeptide (TPR) repeat protein
MFKPLRSEWLCILFFIAFIAIIPSQAQDTPAPLSPTRLLALVAGNALPENIVAAVNARGLGFKPTEEYLGQLNMSGATTEIIDAVNKSAVHESPATDLTRIQLQICSHIALSGKLIQDKQFPEAEQKLNAAVEAGGDKLDAGFVVAEALRQQEQWPMALAVYEEIAKEQPNFPEVQTKLSFVLYRSGDLEESLRVAKSALAVTPKNPEAHKNAALALEGLQKPDAAIAEYREALRIKPNYGVVHYDMGNLLYNKRDYQGAIAEYKSAVALEPKSVEARVNLALSYQEVNQGDLAVQQLREAKKLDPNNFEVRRNLGSLLMHQNLYQDAVTEMRQLEAMAPEDAVCHICLGSALYGTSDFVAAQKEYEIAIRLDPSSSVAERALGKAYEAQQKYDLALKHYRLAQQLEPDSSETQVCIARVMLLTNQAGGALQDLKSALESDPGNPDLHEQYGKALEASGDLEQAKSEYKQAILLDGNNAFAILELAEVQEKQGDWAAAMDNYRNAARKVEATLLHLRGSQQVVDAPGSYSAAKLRFAQHLADLRAAGKSAEAAQLESKIQAEQESQGISGQLDGAMEAGSDAMKAQRYDEALTNYKKAVSLATQIQPHDARLIMSLGYLGNLYYMHKDLANAQATYEQQLKVDSEVFGPTSLQVSQTLAALAHTAMDQGDLARAESLARQDLAIGEKNSGTDSFSYSMSLMVIGYVLMAENKFSEARPYLEKAVKIHEELSGPQAMVLVSSKRLLCSVYDSLQQPAKAEPCNRAELTLLEKYYGANSTALAPVLSSESKSLRELGRSAEADDIDRRLQALHQ